ncbi:MAG: hypothetical protein FD149_1263 [Rhodospirillaceae bacterium]|nr:MAG: hypothetical protein FD149_1263 [Rhodospirillaceae bacterium]
MSESVHFVDMIVYAMIAAFLVLRLRSVLGRRQERRPSDSLEDIQDDQQVHGTDTGDNGGAGPSHPTTPLEAALVQIRIADPRFTTQTFLHGAQSAFESIVGAFANGDRQNLRPLVSQGVFDDFSRVLESRMHAGESVETQVLEEPDLEITDARVQGATAFITIRFVSAQVTVVRDRDGHVVEGDPNRVNKVVDLWTFARDTRSSDPNWILVETRSED